MKRSPTLVARLSRSAPFIAIGLLAILPLISRRPVPDRAAILARNEQVRQTVEQVPHGLNGWNGEDVDIPPAANEVLHANAVLCREYSKGAEHVRLIVVHCSDARDMHGHWPPNCYPANGWYPAEGWVEASEQGVDQADVMLNETSFPMRVYRFEGIGPDGRKQRIRVLGTFLHPDGTVSTDMDVLKSLGGRFETAVEGVAQVQLVTSGDMSLDRVLEAADELLTGTLPLLQVLGYGEEP